MHSGLLRIADLLALQPNLNTLLFIVAEERRCKVMDRAIARPTFRRALKKPLSTKLPLHPVRTTHRASHGDPRDRDTALIPSVRRTTPLVGGVVVASDMAVDRIDLARAQASARR